MDPSKPFRYRNNIYPYFSKLNNMYCTNCGNKIEEYSKFCTNCGNSSVEFNNEIKPEVNHISVVQQVASDEKWWFRLLKVIYIFICLQILWIVPLVWSVNSTEYVSGYYGGYYKDTPDTAFWYSVLAILIYMSLTRLLKIAVLYVSIGKKPQWGKEFKKFY